MTDIGNPMCIFSHLDAQFLGHVINQSGKKVNILDKNVCILHSDNAGTLELAILKIEMQFSTTLVLSLVLPIDSLASFRREWNRNNGSLAKWFRLETVNHIGNLMLHLYSSMIVCLLE